MSSVIREPVGQLVGHVGHVVHFLQLGKALMQTLVGSGMRYWPEGHVLLQPLETHLLHVVPGQRGLSWRHCPDGQEFTQEVPQHEFGRLLGHACSPAMTITPNFQKHRRCMGYQSERQGS